MPRTPEPRISDMPRQVPPAHHDYEDEGPAIPFRKFAPAPVREEPRAQMRPPHEARYEPRTAERPAVSRATMPETPGSMRLPAEAVRLLKATLYELGECKRMLDASRKGST